MQVKFCGAAREVTGSAHLITLDNGFKILLDCGLNQGRGKAVWDINNTWLFDPKDVDVLVLSHAHIDHTGRVPQLVKDGFDGPIYSTHATRSLCAILLQDSAHIQENDVEWYNKKLLKKLSKKKDNHEEPQLRVPLYVGADVPKAMDNYITHGYNKWFHIHPDVEVCYRDAGHILGSASVTLRITEGGKTTLFGFTGDIGRPERPILRDPVPMPDLDYLICESTYGDKLHEGNPEQTDKLLEIIMQTCIEKKGKLIIPAFSVGRTQEIVYMLDKLESAGRLPRIPVYVDSPLAVDATGVYLAHPECYDQNLQNYLRHDENPFGFRNLHYVKDVEDSKALNGYDGAAIIISASGMMNAGRVKHHLYNNIQNPKNTFLIVGYCSPGTPGGILRQGAKEINVFGDLLKVNARVELMDSFSAHGDQEEMQKFLSNQKAKCKGIFLVHGDYDTQQIWQEYLTKHGFKNVQIPQRGEVVKLK